MGRGGRFLTFDELVKLIESFEGIIGALLGVFLTLIVTKWLKDQGKVYVDLKSFTETFKVRDDLGGYKPSEELKEDGYSVIELALNFYNSSENIKSLYDISFSLVDENNDLMHTGQLMDTSTHSFTAGAHRYESFELVNCNPKELFKKELKISFTPSNILLRRVSKKLVVSFKIKKTSFLSRIWNRPINVVIKL
jgi:hypothetical protein